MGKRQEAVKRTIAAVRKKFGRDSIHRFSDGYRGEVTSVIPMGIDVADKWVIGRGGLPVGRIIELFSEEGGGKSSLTLAVLAAAQRAGQITILSETENGINEERAKTFGLDLDELIIMEPDYMEEALGQIQVVLESLDPDLGDTLVAWDSLAATPTKEEIDKGITDKETRDNRAKLLSRAMRQYGNIVMGSRTAFLIVNQTREKRGVMFGNPTTTPGGNAVKFHASLRLQLMGGKAVKDGEHHVGKDVTLIAMKNRFATPFRKARIRLMYDTGWDDEWSTLNLAKDWKLIGSRAKDHEEALAQLEACEWDPKKAKVLANVLADDDEDEE